LVDKMADYAFGSNPPYEFWGKCVRKKSAWRRPSAAVSCRPRAKQPDGRIALGDRQHRSVRFEHDSAMRPAPDKLSALSN